jgi:protein-S-isoprenylcysteine O-methyltransferase Ste14
MVIAKAFVLASFVEVSMFVMVPLVLLTLANGSLTFYINSYRLLGLSPIALGAVFLFWVVLYFALVGNGTPAPFDPPKRLVTDGLFRYMRNPMYFGAVLVLLGEGLFFQSMVILLYAVFTWIAFHLYVVFVKSLC